MPLDSNDQRFAIFERMLSFRPFIFTSVIYPLLWLVNNQQILIPMLKRRPAKLARDGEPDIAQQDSGKPNLTIAEGTSRYHGK
jgi:hypothetical protein